MQSKEQELELLIIWQKAWGRRKVTNIVANAPAHWSVHTWRAPAMLPLIIDDPEDFLPADLPRAQLLLALCENPGLVQLVPDIARQIGASAVIVPVDDHLLLPEGLMNQLNGWLETDEIYSLIPKPFCSLQTRQCNHKPILQNYEHPLIEEFAAHFGSPRFQMQVQDDEIKTIEVLRDTPCGCAQHVAQGLQGVTLDDALEQGGLLHHHFPCLASMHQDEDYHDTLMHVSGNILKEALKDTLQDDLAPPSYLRPAGLTSNEKV